MGDKMTRIAHEKAGQRLIAGLDAKLRDALTD